MQKLESQAVLIFIFRSLGIYLLSFVCMVVERETQKGTVDKIINQMQGNQGLGGPSRNFFSLNRLKADCYYPPVRVDFNSMPTLKSSQSSVLPSYNSDSQFFTPTFLLPAERTSLATNLTSERIKFTEKVNQQIALLAQQPYQQHDLGLKSSQSKHCQICEMKFEDYWQHIAEKSHERKMQLSQFNVFIQELCSHFTSNPKSQSILKKGGSERRKQSKQEGNRRGSSQNWISEQVAKSMQANYSTQILPEPQQLANM